MYAFECSFDTKLPNKHACSVCQSQHPNEFHGQKDDYIFRPFLKLLRLCDFLSSTGMLFKKFESVTEIYVGQFPRPFCLLFAVLPSVCLRGSQDFTGL